MKSRINKISIYFHIKYNNKHDMVHSKLKVIGTIFPTTCKTSYNTIKNNLKTLKSVRVTIISIPNINILLVLWFNNKFLRKSCINNDNVFSPTMAKTCAKINVILVISNSSYVCQLLWRF